MLKVLLERHKPLCKIVTVILCFSVFLTGSLPVLAEMPQPDFTNLIVKELEEYRTEYSKTYLRNDGSLETVVSAAPLHFEHFGGWVEYDNTLELDENTGVYKNKKAPFSVELPDSTNNNKKVTITKDGYTVELKLVGAKGVKSQKPEKVKANNNRKTMTAKEMVNQAVTSYDKIEYTNIYENTKIEYEVDSKSVKENIILNSTPKKAVSYTYQITAEGMLIEKRTNGSIWFYPEQDTAKQNPIFYIPIPFMYDSNDKYSYDIETNLEIKNKKATLTYTPSYKWLTDENRAYPVTIDPTVTMHNGIHDGYTYSYAPFGDNIYGFEDQLKVGKSAWMSDCDYFETYIKFDNLPEFPENYHLFSSSIMITPKKSCGTWEEFIVGAYEITESWQNVYTASGETCLTYNNRPSTSTTASSHTYFNFDFVGCAEAIDITELTKEWYSGEKDNNGVKLSMVNETENAWDSMIFHSSRNTEYAPYLSVVFTDTLIETDCLEIINKPQNDRLYIGNLQRISAIMYPSKTIAENIDYVSIDTNVATIDENGVITAISAGTTEIFAIDTESGLSDSFILTVNNKPIVLYDYKVPENSAIMLGETVEITNNPDVNIYARNSGVVRINGDGTVTGVGIGSTVIEITKPGWEDFRDFELFVLAHIDIGQYLPKDIYTGETYTVYKPDCIGYQYEVNFITNDSSIAYFSANEDNTVFELHALQPGTVNVVFQCPELNLSEQITINIKQKLVESIDIAYNQPSSKVLYVGESIELNAKVFPTVALNKELDWGLSESGIIECDVDLYDSHKVTVTAKSPGKVTLIAYANDNSGVEDRYVIRVVAPVLKITNSKTNNLLVGEKVNLGYSISGNLEFVRWQATGNNIVLLENNIAIANKPGNIKVKAVARNTSNGDFYYSNPITINVKSRKQAVILLHGRTDNTYSCFGAGSLLSGNNNEYDSSLTASVEINNKTYLYTSVDGQRITTNLSTATAVTTDDNAETNGDLAVYLVQKSGYTANINLFAFNYPNVDAVIHNAIKFKVYIDNLVAYARSSNNLDLIYAFYESVEDYENNNYTFNIIGHSMGGLVARYYIENCANVTHYNNNSHSIGSCIYHDNHVNKLITIDTPHWGSGLADVGNYIPEVHDVCDHDLATNAKMFGGSNSENINCNCCDHATYQISPVLNYSRNRHTKYFAVAGVDYNATFLTNNNLCIEVPSNLNTYDEFDAYLQEATNNLLFKNSASIGMDGLLIRYMFNMRSEGDGAVCLCSQIGFTETNTNGIPHKVIDMEKIFVIIDTNGGNFLPTNMLHSKIQKRYVAMQQIDKYLV